MPFPLAHPAAALPLRRLCPTYLDFQALIVGSLVPDLATVIDDWEYFSHTLLGSVVFCLPVGVLTLWLFYKVRVPLVMILPSLHRKALLPLCGSRVRSRVIVVMSLLVGSWLHIIWDLFTHDHSWLVKSSILAKAIHGVPANQILWLLSSASGIAILVITYIVFVQKSDRDRSVAPESDGQAYLRCLGIVTVPFMAAIPLALHESSRSMTTFLRYVAMYYEACAYVTLIVVGVSLRVRAQALDDAGYIACILAEHPQLERETSVQKRRPVGT